MIEVKKTELNEENVVYEAEKDMKNILFYRRKTDGKIVPDRNAIKSSQIRKFYAAVNIINEKLNKYCMEHPGEKNLPSDLQAEIKFLRVKLAYQIGCSKSRWNNPVGKFEEKANLFERIKGIDSIKKFRTFARYVEALVAFHKYYKEGD